MDSATLRYYEDHATEVTRRYREGVGGVQRYFSVAFPSDSTVLEIGAGSGRDMALLLEMGYDVYGVEPARAMIDEAIRHYPQLDGRISQQALPYLDINEPFDGVLCSAVLMHLPETALFDAVLALRDATKDGGHVLISIPETPPARSRDERDAHGRLFHALEPDRLTLLCERLGMNCISEFRDADSLGRCDRHWTTLLFQKSRGEGRPLDRIEGVLNRDRQVATYKLALLRALCDLAAGDDSVADWRMPGRVGVPLALIAERWLFYYWPLLASETFLPQIQSEQPGGARPIRFRHALEALVAHYNTGGFDAFAADYEAGLLDQRGAALTQEALREIRQAIRVGPIRHSAEGSMFEYQSDTRTVFMEAALWHEFALSGHWVRDALALRWAERIQRFDPTLRRGDLVDRLLTVPTQERDVDIARECYTRLPELRCVWSGRVIQTRMLDIDHALPFSLWRNNDLWNLLPTHRQVNHQKRDRVPDARLVDQRADAIQRYWDVLDEHSPRLFAHQRKRVLGAQRSRSPNWPEHLLQFMRRSCEFGIHVRGIPRWNLEE